MRDHRLFIPIAAAAIAAFLAACAPIEFAAYPDKTSAPESTSVNSAAPTGTAETDTLPPETVLILGTLRLEGTDLAVGADQAAVLLPLWQKWHDWNRGPTPAPGDRDALLAEIRAAMTQEQRNAIDAMRLTQADVNAYMEEAARSANPGGGYNPFSNGTQTLSPAELATLQSVYKGAFGGSHGSDWILLHALLDLLESKK